MVRKSAILVSILVSMVAVMSSANEEEDTTAATTTAAYREATVFEEEGEEPNSGPTTSPPEAVEEKAAPWWEQQKDIRNVGCRSSCLQHSKGRLPYLNLCDDSQVCGASGAPRGSVADFATRKCKEWSKALPTLGLDGLGRQEKYQPVKGGWLACEVFCKLGNTPARPWYSPKKELQALGLASTFPDGTWCHADPTNGVNYYCQTGLCLPELQ